MGKKGKGRGKRETEGRSGLRRGGTIVCPDHAIDVTSTPSARVHTTRPSRSSSNACVDNATAAAGACPASADGATASFNGCPPSACAAPQGASVGVTCARTGGEEQKRDPR